MMVSQTWPCGYSETVKTIFPLSWDGKCRLHGLKCPPAKEADGGQK